MRFPFTVATNSLLASAAFGCPGKATIGGEVITTSGTLGGHPAPNRPEVSEYLGIPFAKPPVNALRFAAPQAYRSGAFFNASAYGATCAASVAPANYSILVAAGFNLAPTAEEFLTINSEVGQELSEDCLTLNVWTKPQVGEQRKAVLFYVNGGGFQSGYSSGIFNTGDIIAEDGDVVVITANYRTNVFGFPGLQPEVSNVAPNAGLLDQRLAIEWARDNVAAFGGDPRRITLFGQSAGAASVSMYGFAYAKDLIAHALITQSGTADSFGNAPQNSTGAFLYMASLLNCSSTNNPSESQLESVVACVRSKSTSEILAAKQQVPITYQQASVGIWAPTVDGKSVFANYTKMMAQGRFAKVPRILGNNADEGGFFDIQFTLSGILLPDIFWQFYNLVVFNCPTMTAASNFAELGGRNVWRYIYNGDYPNTQLTVNPSIGAYHGAELRPLFGLADTLGIQDTRAEFATGKLMRKAWAAFAKNPNHALSRAPFSWPKYSGSDSSKIIELGVGNATTAIRRPASESNDTLCSALMPGFEAIGGSNGLLLYGLFALGQLQALNSTSTVFDVLDVLLKTAGLK